MADKYLQKTINLYNKNPVIPGNLHILGNLECDGDSLLNDLECTGDTILDHLEVINNTQLDGELNCIGSATLQTEILPIAPNNIVDVEHGGTGVTSAGIVGNVLTSDGTNWISSPPVSINGVGSVSELVIIDDFISALSSSQSGWSIATSGVRQYSRRSTRRFCYMWLLRS